MNRVDIIGTIAKEDMEWKASEGLRKTVFINGSNQLQYSVKSLMFIDDSYQDKKFFTGYINNLQGYGLEENYYADSYERISEFEEIIEDYLFIFNSIDSTGGYKRLDNVVITIKPSCYEEGMMFKGVPYYTSEDSLESFIQRWQSNKWMKCSQEINQSQGIPFVLWQPMDTTKIYCIGGSTNLINYQEKLHIPSLINTYELTKEEKQLLILHPRYEAQEMAFVETGIYDSLVYQMSQKQEIKTEYIQPFQEVKDNQDLEILDNLELIINKSGFSYGKQELINLHTALKTKSLVILEGMSGTGKSRLVDFYRQAIGLDEKHYKCISVKASWTDEADLLGYLDMMNGCYRPDHEGVVDLLLDAQKHPEELYLLCFDEMNLARVEHYFSQFLSILEMNQSQQVLRLYNDAIEVNNKDIYPSTISLKGNVLFVGTINKDESTHHFSDKVLDRANIIKLGVTSLKDLYKQEEAVRLNRQFISKKWTSNDYFGEDIVPGQLILTNDELEVLEEVHLMLVNSQYDKGIGYRIVRQIEEYIHKLPKGQTILSRDKAFDLQFTQRILSKLRGDRMSLEGILLQEDEERMPIIECLEAYHHVSDFELSKRVILQKVKALKCYGYTM